MDTEEKDTSGFRYSVQLFDVADKSPGNSWRYRIFDRHYMVDSCAGCKTDR